MGLFGNKKKGHDPVRTLSEKEIQARLYGHLREPGPTQEDLPPLSKPKSQETSVLTRSASPVTHKPAHSVPELFEAPESEMEEEIPEKSLPPKNGGATMPNPKAITAQAALKKKGTQIASKIVEWLGWTLAAVVGGIASIHFRKPVVRRAATIGLGIGALALIFFGIHLLNGRREAAMKNPLKPALVTATSAAPSETVQDESIPKVAAEAPKEKESKSDAVEPVSKTPKKKKAASKSFEGPAYVVQVATFASKEDAQKLAERFNAESLNAFLKPLSRSGGRVYYCVFIGQFKTHPDAETALAAFKKKEIAQPFQDAFVRLMQ